MKKTNKCLTCNKEFILYISQMTRGRGKYCSRKCKGMGWNTSLQHNHRWTGGRIKNWAGYILIMSPNHPLKDRHGYVREHRLVMEKYLGRYLLPSEDIDHLNGIKDDNRIENLQILSRSEHVKLEHRRGIYDKALAQLHNRL